MYKRALLHNTYIYNCIQKHTEIHTHRKAPAVAQVPQNKPIFGHILCHPKQREREVSLRNHDLARLPLSLRNHDLAS